MFPESSASRSPSISLCRSKSMCARSDTTSRSGVDRHARSLERLQLVEHGGDVHDDAVAHDAQALLVQDARGNEVQRVLLAAVVVDGVARVRAALATSHHVVLLSSVEVAGEDGWGRRGRGGRESRVRVRVRFERWEGPRGAKKNETRAAAAITTVDPLGLGFRRGRARVAIAGRRRVARETRDRSSPGNAERTRARRRGRSRATPPPDAVAASSRERPIGESSQIARETRGASARETRCRRRRDATERAPGRGCPRACPCPRRPTATPRPRRRNRGCSTPPCSSGARPIAPRQPCSSSRRGGVARDDDDAAASTPARGSASRGARRARPGRPP